MTGRLPNLDDRLARYLDREDESPVRAEIRGVGEALLKHQVACDERWTKEFGSMQHRMTGVEAAATALTTRVSGLESAPPCRPVTPQELAHARAPMPSHPMYEPTEDSRGNMLVPMAEWQALQLERAGEKGQRVGAELALSKVRGSVKFWAALAATVAAGGAWLLEHFRPKS